MLLVDYDTLALDAHPVDLDLLDAAERARAARFRIARDRSRFVVARGALRLELSHRLGIEPPELTFAYGRLGKPGLASPWDRSGITFSISHGDGLALFAFARGAAVGVDLERVRSLRHGEAIVRRFFSPRERGEIAALSGSRWNEAFFRIWTRHEACVKCLGGSALLPPPPQSGITSIADVPVPSGFVAAVCAAATGVVPRHRPLYSAG